MTKTLMLVACGFISPSILASNLVGDAVSGKEKSAVCSACHGMDGNSQLPIYPSLAGQHARYLVKQLKEFKQGAETDGESGRYDPVMSGYAVTLSEQDMLDLAAYFQQSVPQSNMATEASLERGKVLYLAGDAELGAPACIACHGPRGNGTSLSGFPDISGQHSEYTLSQLQKFRDGARHNDMNAMMQGAVMRLTDKDMQAVAEYVAGLY